MLNVLLGMRKEETRWYMDFSFLRSKGMDSFLLMIPVRKHIGLMSENKHWWKMWLLRHGWLIHYQIIAIFQGTDSDWDEPGRIVIDSVGCKISTTFMNFLSRRTLRPEMVLDWKNHICTMHWAGNNATPEKALVSWKPFFFYTLNVPIEKTVKVESSARFYIQYCITRTNTRSGGVYMILSVRK